MSSTPPSPAPSSGTGSLSSISDGIGAFSLHNGPHEAMVKSRPLTNPSTPEPWEGIPRHKTASSEHFQWTVHDDLASMTRPKAGTGSDNDTQFLSPSTRYEVSHMSKSIPIIIYKCRLTAFSNRSSHRGKSTYSRGVLSHPQLFNFFYIM